MPGAGRTAGARVSRCTVSEPAPFDPPIQRLDLARGPLAYTDEGGPAAPRTVVCIHGLPGSHRDFRYLAPELTALGARVVRFDMPGFGDTPTATAAGLTVPDRAQVVREALEALELLDTVLVGHSMGGPVSLHAACEVPERVTALAMLSSPGLTPHRAFVRANVRRSARLLRIGVLRWLLKGALRRGYTRAGFPRSLTHEARVQAVLQAAEVDFEQPLRGVADHGHRSGVQVRTVGRRMPRAQALVDIVGAHTIGQAGRKPVAQVHLVGVPRGDQRAYLLHLGRVRVGRDRGLQGPPRERAGCTCRAGALERLLQRGARDA